MQHCYVRVSAHCVCSKLRGVGGIVGRMGVWCGGVCGVAVFVVCGQVGVFVVW